MPSYIFAEAASDAPLGLISCLGPGEDKYLTIPAVASSVRLCAGQRRVVESKHKANTAG